MPIYEYQCAGCGYRSENFVWHISGDEVRCPHCNGVMARLFTTSNMVLLNRQKPRPFKHDPKECDADKDIWLGVKTDVEKGTMTQKEYRFWKDEMEKSHPEIIT